MLKKLLIALVSTLALSVVGMGIALAATWEYKFPITATDNTSVSRTYEPVMLGFGGQTLINSGKISPTGTDTNMQIGSTSIKYMMSTTNVTAVIPNLPANGQATLDLYTGYSPIQTVFAIIVGHNGYYTVVDAANLELSDNFTLSFNGYIDTSNNTSKYLIYKQNAFDVLVSPTVTGNITATIYKGMTYPIVAAESSGTGTDVGAPFELTVNLPAGITAGNLLLAIAQDASGATITWPAGWTEINETASGGAPDVHQSIAYRYANGSEGASITVTYSAAFTGAYKVYRITGTTKVPEVAGLGELATGNPDPPNLTTSWAIDYNLWLAISSSYQTYTGYPAGYGGTGTVGGAGNPSVAWATRNNAATSENPGQFTMAAGGNAVSHTIAIRPVFITLTTTGVTSGEQTINLIKDSNTAGYYVPTSATDPSSVWANEANAYDNNTATYATAANSPILSWSGYLILNYPSTYYTDTLRFFTEPMHANITNLQVDAYYDGAWYSVFEGAPIASVWRYYTIAATKKQVSQIRYRGYNNDPAVARNVYLSEMQVRLYDFQIWVDGTFREATTANVTVPNNSNNWTFSQNDVMPYINSANITVGGNLIASYQPNTMLSGATLPDRQGGDNPATITWGNNNGIELLYGEMTSSDSTSSGAGTTGGFNLPSAFMPSTWFAMGENVENLPFYDMVHNTVVAMDFPDDTEGVQTIYFIIIVGIAFAAMLGLVVFTKSNLVGFIAMIIVLFIGSSMTVIPMWIPVSILLVGIAIMYLTKQVSY